MYFWAEMRIGKWFRIFSFIFVGFALKVGDLPVAISWRMQPRLQMSAAEAAEWSFFRVSGAW